MKFWNLFIPPKYLDYVMANELKGHEPDIIGFTEIDTGSIRSKKEDKTAFFKEFMELEDQVEKVKYTWKGISKIMKVLPITRKQGNAVISKHKITDVRYHNLNRGTKRVAIECLIEKPEKFRVLLVHLPLGKQARKEQLKELVDIVNGIDEPLLMMGDFNIFGGLKEIRSLLRKTGLRYPPGRKVIHTQPTSKPSKTLDLILVSEEIKVKEYRALKDMKLSDHLPVLIDFDIKRKSS